MREMVDVQYMTTAWDGTTFRYPFHDAGYYDAFGEMDRWVAHISKECLDSFLAPGERTNLTRSGLIEIDSVYRTLGLTT